MPKLSEGLDNSYFGLFIFLKMNKLRFREGKAHVQSHIASKLCF